MIKNKNPIIGINISCELINSRKEGDVKFWSIITENPLPKLLKIKIAGSIPSTEPKKYIFIFILNNVGKIFAIKKGGTPPTNLYIKKYKNSFFLNFCIKLLNFLSNFSFINSFKKKFANKYKHVAPVVKEIETTRVPNHLPKMKPPNNATGLPNPSKKTQIIVSPKNIKVINKKLVSLKPNKKSLFFLINS